MKEPAERQQSGFPVLAANHRFVLTWISVSLASTATAAPPAIDAPPRSQTVILYQQAVLGVIASGTAPISYQWLKGGVPIAGATNDQVVVAQAHFADSGLYSVVASNAEGTTTSAEASLTVNPPKAGDVDLSFRPNEFLDVESLVLQSDGKVLIGGGFDTVNGLSRNNIARLNGDGTLDTGFHPELAGIPNQWYTRRYAIAVQADGKVLIAGPFTAVDGVSRTNIARLNADGTLDNQFHPSLAGIVGVYYSGPHVSTVATPGDGKVLIAGAFTSVDGVSRTNIARLNADGTLDAGFQAAVSGEFIAVKLVTVQPDGKVLIGGDFTTVNDVNRFKIARLNSDGTLDTGFQTAVSSGWVASLAMQSDGKMLIGGAFDMVNGVSRNSLARLNEDGSLDSGFKTKLLGQIASVVVQSDGKLLIGGEFLTLTDLSRANFARLHADGTVDSSFVTLLARDTSRPLTGSLVVNALALQRDGKVLLGGFFFAVNALPVAGIARVWGSADVPPLIQSVSRSGADATLTWEALPNRKYRVQYNETLSTNGWSDLSGDISTSADTARKTESNRGNESQRFYRVVLLP